MSLQTRSLFSSHFKAELNNDTPPTSNPSLDRKGSLKSLVRSVLSPTSPTSMTSPKSAKQLLENTSSPIYQISARSGLVSTKSAKNQTPYSAECLSPSMLHFAVPLIALEETFVTLIQFQKQDLKGILETMFIDKTQDESSIGIVKEFIRLWSKLEFEMKKILNLENENYSSESVLNSKTDKFKISKEAEVNFSQSSDAGLPTLEEIQQSLDSFQVQYQLKIEELKKPSENLSPNAVEREWLSPTDQEILQENLIELWLTLSQKVNLILNKEKNLNLSKDDFAKLTIKDLKLDQLLEFDNKQSLKDVMKNAKRELFFHDIEQKACKFLSHYFLDLKKKNDVFSIFNTKQILNKLNKLNPSEDYSKKEIHELVFKYIVELIQLADVLNNQGVWLLTNKNKLNSVELAAREFPKEMYLLIKSICEEDSKRGKAIIDSLCQGMGDCVLELAQNLASRLSMYIVQSNDFKESKRFLKTSLQSTLTNCITQSNCESSFEGDVRRAILGEYLTLESDRKDISIPRLESAILDNTDVTKNAEEIKNEFEDFKQNEENSKEYHQFHMDLLNFFMQHLDLIENEKDIYQPLKRLNETRSIAIVYKELEAEWNKQGKPKLEGIFKLLALLRGFSQAILFGGHYGMMTVVKFISGEMSRKVIKQPSKPKESDTKNIHFHFESNKVYIKVWRQSALEKINIDNPQDYFNTFVNVETILSTRLKNFEKCKSKTTVKIERSKKEALLPGFRESYAFMLAAVMIMEMDYQIQEID